MKRIGKTQNQILLELRMLDFALKECVASQQLVGQEGYKILMAAVSGELEDKQSQIAKIDCTAKETDVLRAEIRVLTWFRDCSKKAADKIPVLLKRVKVLQELAQRLHDFGIEQRPKATEDLAVDVANLKTEVMSP